MNTIATSRMRSRSSEPAAVPPDQPGARDMTDPVHYVRTCIAGAALLLASCGSDYSIALAGPNQQSSALEFVIHEKHPSAGAGLPYSYIAVHDVATSETVWESQRLD